MRRFAMAITSAALALAASGCVVVVDTWDPPKAVKVVEIDGELYVADTQSRRLYKITDDSAVDRETTTQTDVSSEAEPAGEGETDTGGK